MTSAPLSPILVIKLGALGDFVQAFGPFAAIRAHHPDAKIALLTTPPYASLARASPWFDEVWGDGRPAWWRFDRWLALRRRFAATRFARVYDLQTSSRSSLYFRLMGRPRPEWSGIARGCSHPHANPERDFMHTLERQAEQLRMAGIPSVPPPDLAWLDAGTGHLVPAGPFVLLAPGGAAHRPEKRWPATRYAELARRVAATGYRPVLVGGANEAGLTATIATACPEAIDLAGRTSLFELAGLARRAAGAVGNDTGPMHLVAVLGCPSLVLYSHASDPALCGQRGADVAILRRPRLAELPVAEVEAALRLR